MHVIQPLLNGSIVSILLQLQCLHGPLMNRHIHKNIDLASPRINQRERATALFQSIRLFGCELNFHFRIISHKRGSTQTEEGKPH